MSSLEMSQAALRFIQADMLYVKAVQAAVHFHGKAAHTISSDDLERIRAARQIRDAAEQAMFDVWVQNGVEPV